MRQKTPGVVHEDGTARPQIIRKDVNPLYYDILKAFYEETGIPTLINTSFNRHGEPIVNAPDEAVESFVESELDCLIIENQFIHATHDTPLRQRTASTMD